MASGHGRYARGDNAVAICERCSKKTLRRYLVYDGQYPDMLVCTDCWDPKHPQEYLPDVSDPVTIYDPTGDPEKIAANILDVLWYPGTDPTGTPLRPFAPDPNSPIPPSPIPLPSNPAAENLTINPLAVESVIGASAYQYVVGQTDDPPGLGEIPPPNGTLIAHTETTGTEKPDQFDSSDGSAWAESNFNRNPTGAGQVGNRHGLAYHDDGEGTILWVSVGIEPGGTGSAEIFRSLTNGFDWLPVTAAAGAGEQLWDVAVNSSGRFVAVGDAGHIETSDDGAIWTDRTSGVATDLFSVIWDGTRFIACGLSGVVRTSTDGITWSAFGVTPGGALRLEGIAFAGTRVFVGASDGQVYYTDNSGTSWTASTGVGLGSNIRGIAHDGVSTMIAVGNSSGVYRSTDNGVSFTLITSPTTGFNASAQFRTAIYDDGEPNPYGFVIGGDNGSGQSYLAESVDGSSWSVKVASNVANSAILTVWGEDSR